MFLIFAIFCAIFPNFPFARFITGILWLVFKRAQTVSCGENLLAVITVAGVFHSGIANSNSSSNIPFPDDAIGVRAESSLKKVRDCDAITPTRTAP
jgi:hypothetical protein